MSNYNEIEERLFVLLDTVEKQTAENAEVKNDVLSVLKLIKEQQSIFERQQSILAEQNQSIVSTANEQLKHIQMTQQDFNNLVFKSISVAMKQQIIEEVQGVTINAITDAVSLSAQGIDHELGKLVRDIQELNKKADSGLSKFYQYNLNKSEEIMQSLEYQQEKLGNTYLKMVATIGGGLFLLMCVFFVVIYFMTVPTSSRLEALRQDKAQLIADINQLKRNRAEWIKDANKNGYLKR